MNRRFLFSVRGLLVLAALILIAGSIFIYALLGPLFTHASGSQAVTKAVAASDPAQWVTFTNGHLNMIADTQGNKIPDFSYAGYEGGAKLIPLNPTGTLVNFTPTSSITAIQAALDTGGTSTNPKIVQLSGGTYLLSEPLVIRASNIILEGSSDNNNPTILKGSGTASHELIDTAGSGALKQTDKAHTYPISDTYVPVGTRSFTIKVPGQQSTPFQVGDTISVDIPVTAAWDTAIAMNWVKNIPLSFDRVITNVSSASSGTELITVDAPLTTAIDSAYTAGYISHYTFPGRLTQVGIEHFTLDNSGFNVAYNISAAGCSTLADVDNGWIAQVTCKNFANGIMIPATSKRITEYQDTLDMAPMNSGAHPAAFTVEGQQILCDQCNVAASNMLVWMTQSWVMGPNVFMNSVAVGSENIYAGAHQRWANGTLFDNIALINSKNQPTGDFRLEDEGDRGWSGANEVVWNSVAAGYYLQAPPTAHIWIFGGDVHILPPSYDANLPVGDLVYAEPLNASSNQMIPQSLYLEQLAERNPALGRVGLCSLGQNLLTGCK